MKDALTSEETARATAFFEKLFQLSPERIATVKLDKQNAARLSVVALYGRGTVAHDMMRRNMVTKRIGNSAFSFTEDKSYSRLYRLTTPVQAGIIGREVYVAFEGGKDNPEPMQPERLTRRNSTDGHRYWGY